MEKLLEGIETPVVRTRAEVYRELGARSIEITDDPRTPEEVLEEALKREAEVLERRKR